MGYLIIKKPPLFQSKRAISSINNFLKQILCSWHRIRRYSYILHCQRSRIIRTQSPLKTKSDNPSISSLRKHVNVLWKRLKTKNMGNVHYE